MENGHPLCLLSSRRWSSFTRCAVTYGIMVMPARPIVYHTLLRMSSGARYSGVPHSVHVRPRTRFAKPKSVTCTDRKHMLHKYAITAEMPLQISLPVNQWQRRCWLCWIPTALAGKVMQLVESVCPFVCPSVCFHSTF